MIAEGEPAGAASATQVELSSSPGRSAAMLRLAEGAVNELNRRAEADTLNFAWSELERAQKKPVDAQQTLTAFRTQELLVDLSHIPIN